MEIGDVPNTNGGEAILEGVKFLAGAALGYLFSARPNSWYFYAIPIGAYVLVLVFEWYGERHENRRMNDELDRLRKDRVRAQLNLLLKYLSFDGNPNIRAAFHVPVETENGDVVLEQWIDYVPPGIEDKSGRQFPTSKGIVGRSYRHKESFTENFADGAEYRAKMVADYEFEEDEVEKRTADRRSYFCKPIIPTNTSEVVGLVYFDAAEPGTFPNEWEENDQIRTILTACESIRESV